MRKIYAVTAAILAAGCLASSATAAPDPIKSLNRKVTALEKQVKTLRTDLGEAQTTLDCLGPLWPVARYGGTTEGYFWANMQTQLGFATTALDQPESLTGLTPGVEFVLAMSWDPSCTDYPSRPTLRTLRPVMPDTAGQMLTRFAW